MLQNTVATNVEVCAAAPVAVIIGAGLAEDGCFSTMARKAYQVIEASSSFFGAFASVASEPEGPGPLLS